MQAAPSERASAAMLGLCVSMEIVDIQVVQDILQSGKEPLSFHGLAYGRGARRSGDGAQIDHIRALALA